MGKLSQSIDRLKYLIGYYQICSKLSDMEISQKTGIDIDRYKNIRDEGVPDIELWEILILEEIFNMELINIK